MYIKPFSIEYVIRTTVRNMRKNVDLSIRKTFERLPEFAGDEVKSKEVFDTLAKLHGIRKNLDEYQKINL